MPKNVRTEAARCTIFPPWFRDVLTSSCSFAYYSKLWAPPASWSSLTAFLLWVTGPEWKSTAGTIPLSPLWGDYLCLSPQHHEHQTVPGRWVELTLQGSECLPVPWHPEPHTHLQGTSCSPAEKRERQLSLTRSASGDAQRAPVQLLDCELQTWNTRQTNSLPFGAMLFIASHQRPCKHLTNNHSTIRPENRKIKPGFSGIL